MLIVWPGASVGDSVIHMDQVTTIGQPPELPNGWARIRSGQNRQYAKITPAAAHQNAPRIICWCWFWFIILKCILSILSSSSRPSASTTFPMWFQPELEELYNEIFRWKRAAQALAGRRHGKFEAANERRTMTVKTASIYSCSPYRELAFDIWKTDDWNLAEQLGRTPVNPKKKK